MGKPVTLDSDDVLALLLAAEAMGKAEDVFRARSDDVQVDAIGGVTGMRDRLRRVNQAWNEAQRVEEPLEGPTRADIETLMLLRRFWLHDTMAGDGDHPLPHEPFPDMGTLAALRKKRLIVIGQLIKRIKWGDKTETNIMETTDRPMVKITDRGYKFL